jgi:hypothetical protein
MLHSSRETINESRFLGRIPEIDTIVIKYDSVKLAESFRPFSRTHLMT